MKKGFTLIELLTVISILAILVLIAIPNVIGMYIGSKRNTFINETRIIYGAVEQEYLKDTFNTNGKRVYAKSPEGKCAKELDIVSKDNLYYYVEVNASGKVTKYYIYDDSYQYSSEKYDLKKTDILAEDVYELSEVPERAIVSCDGVLFVSNTTSNVNNELLYTKLIAGPNLNVKMKKLANPDLTTVYSSTSDENITAIKRSQTPPSEENMQESNIISDASSKYPMYMWYDNNDKAIYYYTKASKILLNKNSSHAFRNLAKLTDISGLSDFDTSNVTKMLYMFYSDVELENIDALSSWNTKRVTNMSGLFMGAKTNPMKISSLKPLSNWDTSNVTNMDAIFQSNIGYTSLEGLENWDTSKVTTMRYAFLMNKSLTTLKGIENWDTSNVINMQAMFHECHNLTDASAIKYWDVSKVEDMSNMFNISDFMRPNYSELRVLDLSNWNMASVKNYRWWIESLRFVSAELTIRSTQVTNYGGMFQDTANYCCDANHTNYTCQIIVNYTSETEELVDKMIATKFQYSNVVKGHLVE